MKYGILILTLLFTSQLLAESTEEAPQVLRVTCQGVRFGNLVNTVFIFTQLVPDKEKASELANFKDYKRTDIEIPFKLQMFTANVDLSTNETASKSSNALIRDTDPDKIKEANVVGSRYLSSLRFSKGEEHYFESELEFKSNKYRGSFLDFGMKFQCSTPYFTDFEEPKPGMKDMTREIQTAEIQDGDACSVGLDKECVEVQVRAAN